MASLESLRLSQAQSTPKVVQTEPANVPGNPISPKPLQTTTLTGVVGLLAMGGFAFAIEYLDDTIKTPEDIKRLTGLPVIGLIGDINAHGSLKNGNNNNHPLFASSQPRSVVSEAIRSLRTNLEFAAVDEPINTILITSGTPGDGKSTLAANFAWVVAQSGKKTLLLDADMRRPSIHKFFDLSNRLGLSDLIRSKNSMDQLINPVKSQPNLSVITSGRIPPDPSDLLSSKRMKKLIKEFRSTFDVTIIDCSPMVVSDPQILASRVDGILYVVEPGKIRTPQITTPIEQLKRVNAKVLGIVFNRISAKNNAYYYGGYYYYSSYNQKGETGYFSDQIDAT
jgi:capsular exopolysaccharide synthesis family protein